MPADHLAVAVSAYDVYAASGACGHGHPGALRTELAVEAVRRGIVATIAAVTIWRWLHEDAIRPWNYRSWIFPRDPQFAEKAGRILDLYEGRGDGKLLEPDDFVVCCDEKPSTQARARIHPSEPAKAHGGGQRVEHEYQRRGALSDFAGLGRTPRQAV